ncbi:MAG: hypothetical protein Q6365_021305, partial [Candidatus Sigynarchaeota archaeon]
MIKSDIEATIADHAIPAIDSEILVDYLAGLDEQSTNSFVEARRVIFDFYTATNLKSLVDFTADDANEYVAYLKALTLKNSSKRVYLLWVNACTNHAKT